jgi:hypothetical protein
MASLFTIFAAVFFAAVALGVLYILLRSIGGAISGDPRQWFEALKVRRRERGLVVADELMRTNHRLEALRKLRAAFFFEHPVFFQSTIERIHAHHMNILSRLLGDAHGRRHQIDNLPIIEDLLASREHLLAGYIEHVAARHNLAARRRRDHKETPAWAIAEFSKKIEDIVDRLNTNRHALESQLDSLIDTLRRIPETEEVTVH